MKTFADRIIAFNKQLEFNETLPHGISVMNPFKDKNVLALSSAFYKKYYNDNCSRHLILGINPGRFGGGITGIPFTDPKRVNEKCGLVYNGEPRHEPSSVFVYDVIDAFGGAAKFYKHFYIHSVFPLGFTKINNIGKPINYNYYDSKELMKAAYDFIVENIKKQIDLGIETDTCFCFGTGKNEQFLKLLNQEKKFFKKIIALEHPRFIMQYKSKSKQLYIDKYLSAFNAVI